MYDGRGGFGGQCTFPVSRAAWDFPSNNDLFRGHLEEQPIDCVVVLRSREDILGIFTGMMNWAFRRSAPFVSIFWIRVGGNRDALRYARHKLSDLGKEQNFPM